MLSSTMLTSNAWLRRSTSPLSKSGGTDGIVTVRLRMALPRLSRRPRTRTTRRRRTGWRMLTPG